ncbi:glycoside hydrolase family 20 zincin-like fold domain-containing protein [Amycolatopsis thermoflava]|uniref:glycoside hydrolase family 20 zincin-like fold domain-containing protein n=1 Tax=Amycolatopsis thermoflava TaxID=84480 RepID=UPI001428ABAA|nr:glycoside hydrolase family 20 zincin-like fold domain-containing protein [Amycolatopsis thermoflava]
MSSVAGPALVPQPRRASWTGRTVRVSTLLVAELDEGLRKYEDHIRRIAGLVSGDPSLPALPVTFHRAGLRREAYEIQLDETGVRVSAGDSLGALHAVRTLLDVWDWGGNGSLPEGEVADWPTFAVRGVFVESFAGTDRMSIEDWRQFLDRMSQLKINTVGVSIYGCWDIRHDGSPSEYLFTPLPGYPQLESPQHVTTWSAETEREVDLDYLPAMFAGRFFGEVVRYADRLGVQIIPHLGGPGHSTLVPRALPALSALDDEGAPTGYGYCVSRPEARAELARLVRCLVAEHLRPNGLSRLHVAGDEYYPIRNVDPADRRRVVSPYCRCVGCRSLSPGDMLIEYLLCVGEVLAGEGVAMVHWHDTLVREGVLDRYLDAVEERDLPVPVIAWWKYNDPAPRPNADRAETWCCPTTGLFPHLFQQDFSGNIEAVLRRGHNAGAQGALAYSLPDPADHANYACFADLSWNLEHSGGAGGFQQRWARYIANDEHDVALQAIRSAGSVTASYPLMMYIVHHLLPYFSTAAAGSTQYPDDLLRSFAIIQPPMADVLRQVAATLRDAVSIMPEGRVVRFWPEPVTQWKAESGRLAATADLFLAVIEAARRPTLTSQEVERLSADGRELLKTAATTKPAYLAPLVVREHWGFVREIETSLDRLRTGPGLQGEEQWHAWIV